MGIADREIVSFLSLADSNIRKTFPMREQEGRAVLRAARSFQKEVPVRETKV